MQTDQLSSTFFIFVLHQDTKHECETDRHGLEDERHVDRKFQIQATAALQQQGFSCWLAGNPLRLDGSSLERTDDSPGLVDASETPGLADMGNSLGVIDIHSG